MLRSTLVCSAILFVVVSSKPFGAWEVPWATSKHCTFYDKFDCDKLGKRPACDANGKKYINNCFFYKAQCLEPSLLYKRCPKDPKTTTPTEQCQRIREKDCNSTIRYTVCGSDGTAYKSRCLFNKALCLNPALNIVKCEPCLTKWAAADCKGSMWKGLTEFCDDQGNTYNYCQFHKKLCDPSDTTKYERCHPPSNTTKGM